MEGQNEISQNRAVQDERASQAIEETMTANRLLFEMHVRELYTFVRN
jgi:hypothetical protein